MFFHEKELLKIGIGDVRLPSLASAWPCPIRQLERANPSAACRLEEGLEETFTVHRLGVGDLLRRTLSTTDEMKSAPTESTLFLLDKF